jgi:hypothetical protein
MAQQDSMHFPKTGSSPAGAIPLLRRSGEVLWEILLLLGLGVAVGLLARESALQHAPDNPVSRYEADLRAVAGEIQRYQAECGVLPARLRDLAEATGASCVLTASATPVRWRDAWGSGYHYRPSAGRFTLRSAGRDRVVLTSDDIVWGDAAKAWRPHYRPPTDWLRLFFALATVLAAVFFVGKLSGLVWRGGLACGRLLRWQRLDRLVGWVS